MSTIQRNNSQQPSNNSGNSQQSHYDVIQPRTMRPWAPSQFSSVDNSSRQQYDLRVCISTDDNDRLKNENDTMRALLEKMQRQQSKNLEDLNRLLTTIADLKEQVARGDATIGRQINKIDELTMEVEMLRLSICSTTQAKAQPLEQSVRIIRAAPKTQAEEEDQYSRALEESKQSERTAQDEAAEQYRRALEESKRANQSNEVSISRYPKTRRN
jgi:chromosome segregation ATPase